MPDPRPSFQVDDGSGPVTTDIQGQLDDTSTVLATEDNYATVRITQYRALHTNLRNNSGTEVGTASNPIGVNIVQNSSNDNRWNSKLRYIDMNASNGGIARGTAVTTSWTDVFSYTGSGNLAGFILNVETFSDWKFRLLIDGEEVFGSDGMLVVDMSNDAIYDVDDVTDVNQAFLGLSKGAHDRIVFTSPLNKMIRYTSSIVIKLARVSGSKKFQAGLVILSKET